MQPRNVAETWIWNQIGKAEAMNERFLSSVSAETSTRYEYYLNTLINLKENLSAEEYRKLLGEHLDRFLEATNLS